MVSLKPSKVKGIMRTSMACAGIYKHGGVNHGDGKPVQSLKLHFVLVSHSLN